MLVTMRGGVMLTFWIRSGPEPRFFSTKSCSIVEPDSVASKWKRGSTTVVFGASEAGAADVNAMLRRTTPTTRIIAFRAEIGGRQASPHLTASRKNLLRIETHLSELQPIVVILPKEIDKTGLEQRNVPRGCVDRG